MLWLSFMEPKTTKVPSHELKSILKCPLGCQTCIIVSFWEPKCVQMPFWDPKHTQVPSYELKCMLKYPLGSQNMNLSVTFAPQTCVQVPL